MAKRVIAFPPLPAAAAQPAAAPGTFPFPVENQYFTALETQVVQTARIPTAIDNLGGELAKRSGTLPASIDKLTNEIARGGGAMNTALGSISTAINNFGGRPPLDLTPIVQAIDKAGAAPAIDLKPIVDAIRELQATVQDLTDTTLNRRGADNVTALFAAAVDTSGDIVDRTLAGRWLNDGGYKTLADIARAKPKIRRDDFIARLLKTAGNFGPLPSAMSEQDIGRFFDFTPAVLDAIEQSKPTS